MRQTNFYFLLGTGFLIILFLAGIFFLNFQSLAKEGAISPSIQTEIRQSYPRTTYLPVELSPAPDEVWVKPELKAQAALIFELTSKRLLFEKGIQEKLPIASLTKLMTALVALENFSGQRDDRFFILEDDLKTENSYSDLKPGDNFSFEELLHLMLIRSDNVAAVVIAKAVAGSEAEFIAKMNQKAQSLGMKNTLFSDATGLGNNISTAEDLRLLTEEILKSSPEIFSISKIGELTIIGPNKRTFKVKNTNILIDKIPGLAGSKTGFTPEALGSLLLVFKDNQRMLLSVVLNSEDRFGDTAALLNWYWRLNSANIY